MGAPGGDLALVPPSERTVKVEYGEPCIRCANLTAAWGTGVVDVENEETGEKVRAIITTRCCVRCSWPAIHPTSFTALCMIGAGQTPPESGFRGPDSMS